MNWCSCESPSAVKLGERKTRARREGVSGYVGEYHGVEPRVVEKLVDLLCWYAPYFLYRGDIHADIRYSGREAGGVAKIGLVEVG